MKSADQEDTAVHFPINSFLVITSLILPYNILPNIFILRKTPHSFRIILHQLLFITDQHLLFIRILKIRQPVVCCFSVINHIKCNNRHIENMKLNAY